MVNIGYMVDYRIKIEIFIFILNKSYLIVFQIVGNIFYLGGSLQREFIFIKLGLVFKKKVVRVYYIVEKNREIV